MYYYQIFIAFFKFLMGQQCWDIINGFGQDLIDNVKKNESNSDVVNAHARVLLFMVGKAYGATRYQIRPWNNDRELNKIAEALVFQIKIKNPTTKMYSILESLQDKFKYRKIYHDSWLSKVGHVLWPEACPVYDSRATFTLGKIGKYIGSDLPHSINGWRDDDCTWDKYINYMYTVLIIFKKNYHSRPVNNQTISTA
jgi:hypothetical protein